MSVTQSASLEPHNGTASSRWLRIALLAIMIGASLSPIWATAHFPSQNGPWYLLAAQMTKEYDNPQLGYADSYLLSYHPIPHMLHTLLVYGFTYVAPILMAQKLALSTYVLLLPLSVFYFLSIAAPDKKVLGYFAFLMVHNYTFYRGYHNFSLSIPLFFLAFGFWLQHRKTMTTWRIGVLSLLVVLLYLAHLFGFLILVFAIGWYQLVEARSIPKALRSVVLATWPGWLLVAHFIVLNTQVNTWIDRSERVWLLPHVSAEGFVRNFFYTTSAPAYAIGVAAFLWIVYLLARGALGIVRSPEGWRGFGKEPLLTMVIVLVVIYFVTPWKFMNWHKINARLIPFILGLSLACAGSLPLWHRRLRFRWVFLTTVCLAALGIDAIMTREVLMLEEYVQQYTSGINCVAMNKKLLPVHLENPAFGRIRPLTRAHEYYQIEKGGANGYGAAYFNTLVPVWYRAYPIQETFPRYDPSIPEQSVKRVAEVYDYVLLWGTDAVLENRLESHGFHCVHHNGKLALYGKEGSKPKPSVATAFAESPDEAKQKRAQPL